ncbi:uncharacterized protein LOC143033792 [Oratosquilla oratoria]|uniref:uncharacterized protein LOC143033792 n=1 Tax=Oratosquilla oratoria TaxID=337810 RepID=UPI003F75D031
MVRIGKDHNKKYIAAVEECLEIKGENDTSDTNIEKGYRHLCTGKDVGSLIPAKVYRHLLYRRSCTSWYISKINIEANDMYKVKEITPSGYLDRRPVGMTTAVKCVCPDTSPGDINVQNFTCLPSFEYFTKNFQGCIPRLCNKTEVAPYPMNGTMDWNGGINIKDTFTYTCPDRHIFEGHWTQSLINNCSCDDWTYQDIAEKQLPECQRKFSTHTVFI